MPEQLYRLAEDKRGRRVKFIQVDMFYSHVYKTMQLHIRVDTEIAGREKIHTSERWFSDTSVYYRAIGAMATRAHALMLSGHGTARPFMGGGTGWVYYRTEEV